MRQLDEFFDYKNQLMGDLMTDETVVRLMTDKPELVANPEKLIYEQAFPYEYVPETLEHGHTYVCCDVDIRRVDNSTFLTPTLFVWVFTHKSKLRLEAGGVRTDALCSEICELLNGSRMYGLGELNLYSVKRFAPVGDFQGKVMTFIAKDFNRLSPTGKPVPSNRKRG